jgi:hypothetical protein
VHNSDYQPASSIRSCRNALLAAVFLLNCVGPVAYAAAAEGFAVPKEVETVLAAYCVDCHGANGKGNVHLFPRPPAAFEAVVVKKAAPTDDEIQAADAPSKKPNILVIFTDHFDFEELGMYVYPEIPTYNGIYLDDLTITTQTMG